MASAWAYREFCLAVECCTTWCQCNDDANLSVSAIILVVRFCPVLRAVAGDQGVAHYVEAEV